MYRSIVLALLLLSILGVLPANAQTSHAKKHKTKKTALKDTAMHISPSGSEETGIPKEGEFIDVTVEPQPIFPIEQLIVYPEQARRKNLEGQVVLDALISKTGDVVKVNVLKSTDSIFNHAAMEALSKARFTPARDGNNKPVALWVTRSIRFKLH